MATHASFVRAAYATEHLLLAHIRTSGQTGLGVTDLPSRLKSWVAGYPSMVASDADLARATPRQGAKMVRCERVSRSVRAYSRDLIGTAELWADDIEHWEAWERVVLKQRRGEIARPKFSAAWRRRLAVKENLPLPPSAFEKGQAGYGLAPRPTASGGIAGRQHAGLDDESRWGSVAGKEWSMFEEGGFDVPSVGDKDDLKTRLQFDLSETAKQASLSERYLSQ